MIHSWLKHLPGGRSLIIVVPYLWMLLFFLIPFIIVFKISFSTSALSIPPYRELLQWTDEAVKLTVHFGNYLFLMEDRLYWVAYLSSLKIAAIATILCLLICYPVAYAMAHAPSHWRNLLLMLVVLPSWTSFLIRVYAWMGILKNNGYLNNLLIWAGILDEPIQMLNSSFAVYIGIVYAYMPFMILPHEKNLQRGGTQIHTCFFKGPVDFLQSRRKDNRNECGTERYMGNPDGEHSSSARPAKRLFHRDKKQKQRKPSDDFRHHQWSGDHTRKGHFTAESPQTDQG